MHKYTITVYRNNFEIAEFTVMAECHEQHSYYDDTLVGVSDTGRKKLNKYDKEDIVMRTSTPNHPRLIGWR